jgi:hypothetical protein
MSAGNVVEAVVQVHNDTYIGNTDTKIQVKVETIVK